MREARRLAALARRRARGRGAKAKLKAAAKLEEFADRCEKVAKQIKQRVAGEPITERIVSLFDPDARPIRKGKLGQAQRIWVVSQLAEVTENTKRGARGLILPASTKLGNPAEKTLLPSTVAELERLGIRPREVAVDGGFKPGPTNTAFENLAPQQVFIAGRQEPASKRTPAGCGATEPARRAGSVTSNAATDWTDPASKATKASRSGLSGRSSPTTPTRSPSEPSETLPTAPSTGANPFTTNGRARSLRGRFVSQEFFRGK